MSNAGRPKGDAVPGAGAPKVAGRREVLAEAAVQVIARGGLRGLTHRAVDAEAGLPEGSCSAYLRTRLALLTAVTQHVGTALTADVAGMRSSLATAPGDVEKLVAAAGALLRGWTVDRPELLLAQAELSLEAIRQPQLRAAIDPWRADLLDVVAGLGEAAGRSEPRRLAELVSAALEGVLVRSLLLPERERSAYVVDQTSTLLRALVAAHPA